MLSADFGHLERDTRMVDASAAEWVHIDVMDGVFDDPAACIGLIRDAGVKAGISIKPATPVEALRGVLPLVDLVLVMSVEPGFGGQSFIPGSLEKIAQLRAMAREMGLETIIEVDGGISARNAGAVYGAGADVLVAGSSVFGAEDPQAEVVKMLNA